MLLEIDDLHRHVETRFSMMSSLTNQKPGNTSKMTNQKTGKCY